MVLGRFLWFFMGKNLQKLNWHGTDVGSHHEPAFPHVRPTSIRYITPNITSHHRTTSPFPRAPPRTHVDAEGI